MNCLQCEATIEQKRNTKKFCSPKCRVYFNRQKGLYLVNGVDKIQRVDLSEKGSAPAPKVHMVTEYTAKVFDFCKHNQVKGFCKKGCK